MSDDERDQVVAETKRQIGLMLFEIAATFPRGNAGDQCISLVSPLIEWLIPEHDRAWDLLDRVGKVNS